VERQKSLSSPVPTPTPARPAPSSAAGAPVTRGALPAARRLHVGVPIGKNPSMPYTSGKPGCDGYGSFRAKETPRSAASVSLCVVGHRPPPPPEVRWFDRGPSQLGCTGSGAGLLARTTCRSPDGLWIRPSGSPMCLLPSCWRQRSYCSRHHASVRRSRVGSTARLRLSSPPPGPARSHVERVASSARQTAELDGGA